MRRILSIVIFLMWICWLPAQVGVNTTNPQGVFHIDAAGDNNPAGAPAVAQQANDLYIDNRGNVGLGTTSPTTGVKLDINGGIRIVDGTQGVSKVLTTPAGDGRAQWAYAVPLEYREGTLISPMDTGGAHLILGASSATATNITVSPLKVTPGRWLIYGSCAMAIPGGTSENIRRGYACLALRSTTGVQYNQIGFSQELYAGQVAYPFMYYIIEVTTAVDLRLFAWNPSGQSDYTTGRIINCHFWGIKLG